MKPPGALELERWPFNREALCAGPCRYQHPLPPMHRDTCAFNLYAELVWPAVPIGLLRLHAEEIVR